MSPKARALALALFFLLLTAGSAGADGPLDREMRAIAKQLRCPVCQNISVLDSPTPLAIQMRAIIQEKLEAGESEEEIIRYFVQRYGEGILLEPPKRGFGLLVWLGPVLILLVGAALVFSALRPRHREADAPPPQDQAYRQRLEQEIALRDGSAPPPDQRTEERRP